MAILLRTVLLAVFAMLLTVVVATAHSVEVVEAEPPAGTTLKQSPARVVVRLNEELRTRESTVQVFTAAGQQVDLGDGGVDLTDADHATLTVRLPALTASSYTVRWRAVLEDGDVTTGEFTFSVGNRVINQRPASITTPMRNDVGVLFTWVGAGLAACLMITALGFTWHKRLRKTDS